MVIWSENYLSCYLARILYKVRQNFNRSLKLFSIADQFNFYMTITFFLLINIRMTMRKSLLKTEQFCMFEKGHDACKLSNSGMFLFKYSPLCNRPLFKVLKQTLKDIKHYESNWTVLYV